jgi:1-acyl-sn-glycerol-3-phosphate acyltransferase
VKAITTLFLFVVRMIAIALWTLAVHGAMRFAQIFHIAGMYKKRPCGFIGLWGKGLARIMGLKIHRVNERTGPPGDIVVSNHLGFLDVPLLLSFFPAIFIIKAEIGRLRFSGRALRNERHIFVERGEAASRNQARQALTEALNDGARVIVFPEGRGAPGAERLPFKPYSFVAANRLKKRLEVVAIDYLPDRSRFAWDIKKPMFPQFAALLGRPRTHVSIEFLWAGVPEDPTRDAERFKELIEQKLKENDARREGGRLRDR